MKFVQILAASLCCVMASAAYASDASSGAITHPQATQNGAVIFVHSGTRTTPPSCTIWGDTETVAILLINE